MTLSREKLIEGYTRFVPDLLADLHASRQREDRNRSGDRRALLSGCHRACGMSSTRGRRKRLASRRLLLGTHRTIIFWLCLFLWSHAVALAADWPPTSDHKNATTRSLDGRSIERYTHGPRPEWGYADSSPSEWAYPAAQEAGAAGQNRSSFYVVAPRTPHKNAPLCVVLHSANTTGFDYLGSQFLNRKINGGDDPGGVMTLIPDDCYSLYLNSTNNEWWGWGMVRNDPTRYASIPTPVEKRVLDTIEWVAAHYEIDRNRIYASGTSMGGCGALGICLPHGDIFAAVMVVVPAGTEYVALRRGFPAAPAAGASPAERDLWTKRISGFGLPDPPPVVDFSAPNDTWSKTQPVLLNAALAGRLPLVVGWGPFGHTAFRTPILKYPECEVAMAFPWLEIHKNAAYPVFTNASSDQRAPWLGTKSGFDESGQINAYFRWKDQQDEPSKFTMKLWIAHPTVKNPPTTMPDASTADVTLRRLQRFNVRPGKTYTWRMVRNGKQVASGKITPDAANLLNFPKLALTTTPAELSVKAENR